MLQIFLSAQELHCIKYHFTVNGAPTEFDKYKSTIKLSKDFKQLIIHSYRPDEDNVAVKNKMKKLKKQQNIIKKMMKNK